jgi:hypothetical protein
VYYNISISVKRSCRHRTYKKGIREVCNVEYCIIIAIHSSESIRSEPNTPAMLSTLLNSCSQVVYHSVTAFSQIEECTQRRQPGDDSVSARYDDLTFST